MPISAPPIKAAGFTLIEMLVVLTIIGLVAAAAAVRLGGQPSGPARHRAVQTLRAAFAQARADASATGRSTAVRPETLVPEARLAAPAFAAPAGEILFYPDGSSSAGTVSVGGTAVLEVDWLTGETRDAG